MLHFVFFSFRLSISNGKHHLALENIQRINTELSPCSWRSAGSALEFGYPFLGPSILVKWQWINNSELLGEHFPGGRHLFMKAQMFWTGLQRNLGKQQPANSPGSPATCLWDCWETCPLGLIYLHHVTWIWATDFPKKQAHASTALLNKAILRPQPTCDHMNQSDTLFCAKKVGFCWLCSVVCTAHPTRTQPATKATSQSSCQIYPQMLPAFSSLIILSASASHSYLQAPVGKRQSWEKDIIPTFRSDLKTFSQAWIFVMTPIWHLRNSSLW